MRSKCFRLLLAVVFAGILLVLPTATGIAADRATNGLLHFGVTPGAHAVSMDLVKSARRSERFRGASLIGEVQSITPESSAPDFVANRYGIIVRAERGRWNIFEDDKIRRRFGRDVAIPEQEIGQVVVHVIVNGKNRVRSLTLSEFERIFRAERVAANDGPILDWKGAADGEHSGTINFFMPPAASNDTYIMRLHGLRGQQIGAKAADFSKEPYAQQSSVAGVIGAVINDPNGIGFFAAAPDFKLDSRVKLVAIAKDDESEAFQPTPESVYEGNYPLVGPMMIYRHPDAPSEAREFCEFAASAEAASIIKRHRLWPEYERQEYFSNKRLAAAKKGEGVKLTMVGPRAGMALMRELAAEYVKAEEVVQLGYGVRNQTLAVRDFVTRARDWKEGEKYRREAELILMDDKIRMDALRDYGPSWQKSIHPQEAWELGRIGVAVVAHKTNPAEWLSMEELRDIYATNRIRDWQQVRGQPGAMKRHGLKAGQPVFLVFVDKTLEGRPISQYTQRDTTEEVIASVAVDPGAIGFVSLTDLKPEENRVKILGITPKDGQFPETIGPEGPTENYPLQQRWKLYLGPYHSPETKRFAKHIASNEAAAAVMRKNGLIAASTITADPLKRATTSGEKPVFVVPD